MADSEGNRGLWYFNRDTMKMERKAPSAKAEVLAPYVQTDEIPPTVSHVDDEGRTYTSKRKLFDDYKAHGFECTGGDHLTGKPPPQKTREQRYKEIRDDVEKAYYDAKYQRVPLTEKEKEACLREERMFREYKKRQK